MESINGLHEQPCSFGKIYRFPDGSFDIVAANAPIFKPKGFEKSGAAAPQRAAGPRVKREPKKDREDIERAQRRARAKLRRLALANEFKWFVTLTIDPKKIDSFDEKAVVKRTGQWCSNQVKRRGLKYVLVPEHHKSGRIHFHGFFTDVFPVVDSGIVDAGGHRIYNLPAWDYGFTTAIELYGEYSSAVGYVCKYIGKEAEKIGGRWYYSGGALAQPREEFVDISADDLVEMFPEHWKKEVPGGVFAGINGVKENG